MMGIDPQTGYRTPRAGQRGALLAITPLIACVLVASCGDAGSNPPPDPNAPQYGVRDSAGIRIAENPRPAPDSRLGWVVSAEPLVSIGTTEGESTFQLFRVADATRLTDGKIVVANGGSLELLVFDAEGNHLASWGGEGEGPGEFARLNRVRPWAGDSLIAADPGRGRVAIFDSQGTHGRTAGLLGQSDGEVMMATTTDQAPAPLGLAVGPDALIGVLPDGTLFTRDDDIVTAGFSRQDYAYALKTIGGETSVSLGQHPGPQIYTERYNAGGGFLFIPMAHPFGQTTHTAIWGDLAVLGRTETYEIKGYRSDGSLARIVRRDFEPGTPTQAEQDTRFRELLARYSEERRAQRTEANVPLVDAFPAFGAVVGDALGHLWVAEFERPGDNYDGTLWTVFNGDGRMLGLVPTPAIVTVFEIGEDYILGEATDELGVEYVQLWGLDRQASMDLTGCYDVTEGEWVVEETVPGEELGLVPSELGYDSVDYQIPPRIQFAGPSDRRFSATDVVVPEGALPTPHRYTTGEIIGDSLVLVFSTGHVGVLASLARSGTGWSGTARTWVDHSPRQVNARPVELTQVPCDSPPPVSSDVMPPVPRTVELESGLAITLGEPLPASLETVAPEPDSVQRVSVRLAIRIADRTRGLFGTTDDISVDLTRDGLVRTIRLWYVGAEDHATLEARLRSWYTEPGVQPLGITGANLMYMNRTTLLLLAASEGDGVEIDLSDIRL